ncbi:hypothetical protein H4582DRAFT_2100033 [Lactarius indigo]|nr:hypothetical protein H4582DRAFT_2100033 [Lactarius indigo]
MFSTNLGRGSNKAALVDPQSPKDGILFSRSRFGNPPKEQSDPLSDLASVPVVSGNLNETLKMRAIETPRKYGADRHKYKYLSIPDESISFGTVTATQIDVTIIVGSVANGLNSSGFSALPVLALVLAVSASEGTIILRNAPSILAITIPSHATSPIVYIYLRSSSTLAPTSVSAKPPNPATPAPGEAPSFDIVDEQRLLQDLVDEALAQGVRTACARRLYGQEPFEARPNTRLGMTAGLSRKECERAAGVIKAAVAKVLATRK